jgi:hypothetical protein
VVEGMNCLRPRKHGDRGFEPHLKHGYLYVFILCLCCPVCAGSGLARADPCPRSPTDCVKDQETQKAVKANQKGVEP